VGDSARTATVILALAALLIAVGLIAAAIGPYAIAPGDILSAIAQRLSGTPQGGPIDTVLFNIRLPRIAAAALVGAALAAAGASYQTLFRNPLVSPDILGVSAGAGFGAVTGILLSLPVACIQLFGFAGGLITVGIVVSLASLLRGQNETLVLVLAGIVVGTLAGSGIAFVKVIADPYDQLPAITFWLLGSLVGVKSPDLLSLLIPVVLGLIPLAALRWRIGVLSLGDDEARALGVNVARLRLIVIIAATLITASAVAVSGVIGWVGLMVPHMGRFLVGPRYDRLLTVSLLLGAIFVVVVDTLARTIARIEMPLGVLTAVVGAPVFVWLLARGKKPWS
jgi:iron complex transport system permease protein